MMNQKIKSVINIIIGVVVGATTMYFFNNYKIEKKEQTEVETRVTEVKTTRNEVPVPISVSKSNIESNSEKSNLPSEGSIDQLTQEDIVVSYLKEHGNLPNYYITKSEAKSQGWVPSQGNLCEVLPGRAIGGDVWTNRQKSLPTKSGRRYFEADLNYNCGNRNAYRVVYSNDGLIFVTHDHYRTFDEK